MTTLTPLARRVLEAAQRLAAERGREPTRADLARALSVNHSQVNATVSGLVALGLAEVSAMWGRVTVTERVAWHLPRSVAMWATIRVAAHATTGEWGDTLAPAVTITEMLERWKPPVSYRGGTS